MPGSPRTGWLWAAGLVQMPVQSVPRRGKAREDRRQLAQSMGWQVLGWTSEVVAAAAGCLVVSAARRSAAACCDWPHWSTKPVAPAQAAPCSFGIGPSPASFATRMAAHVAAVRSRAASVPAAALGIGGTLAPSTGLASGRSTESESTSLPGCQPPFINKGHSTGAAPARASAAGSFPGPFGRPSCGRA